MRTLKHKRRVGSVPGCLALMSHDIGVGETESGDTLYFAWGANWNAHEAKQLGASIVLDVVDTGEVWGDGEPRRNYAPVIPAEAIGTLLPILTP